MRAREIAFDIGRRLGNHPVASRLFCLTERVLPVKRLARSEHAVAFHHPKPSWDPHILIVPTVPFPALSSMRPVTVTKAWLLWEILQLARDVTGEHENEWQLIINGGERQDIGQVHGHLIHHTSEVNRTDLWLSDPDQEFGAWETLFELAASAAEFPGNGYSLIFEISEHGAVGVAITQSRST